MLPYQIVWSLPIGLGLFILKILNLNFRRIKNRKINVIETLKRPVPLEHFLYTGQDGKTKNDRFLIMDKNGEMQMGK